MLRVTNLSGFGGGAQPVEVEDGLGDVATSTARTFGDSGGDINIGLQFTASQNGEITQAAINVDSVTTAFNCHAELWTDSSGSPGSQVGSDSATVNLNSTGSKTFTFSTPPVVANGVTYWMVLVDESAPGTGSVGIDVTTDQAGFGSGDHDTITSITDTGANGNAEEWKIGITNNG